VLWSGVSLHFRLWLESTGRGPSFASVDVEKVKPRKLDEDKARPLESKYQLSLRTSNLPGLVSTGKMIANEGGAVTCKFNSFEEDNTVPYSRPGAIERCV